MLLVQMRQRFSVTAARSEEHTSELQSRSDLVCRLLLEKKKKIRETSRALHRTVHSLDATAGEFRLDRVRRRRGTPQTPRTLTNRNLAGWRSRTTTVVEH